VFWAVARHLPGIYPRFAYLSAPLISGSGRNDRETANEIRSSAEIVKRIRKLLVCRDERVLRSSLRGKASDGNDKENRFSDLRTSITGAARGGERYWITLLSRSHVIRSVVCYIGFPPWRKELILRRRGARNTRERDSFSAISANYTVSKVTREERTFYFSGLSKRCTIRTYLEIASICFAKWRSCGRCR